MSNVVVKQGKPSASGEVVDTSAAKVVPPSPEVKTEAAAREVAGQKKATQAKIGALAKGMTHPARAKDEAVKAVTGKGKTKAKPAAAKRETGNAVPRLTTEWTGKDGKDVAVKDRVKLPNGIVIDVIGRWTKKTAKGNVPMVTGHIVTLPTGAGTPTTKKVGDRCNAVAAEATRVKK